MFQKTTHIEILFDRSLLELYDSIYDTTNIYIDWKKEDF